jgi:transposase
VQAIEARIEGVQIAGRSGGEHILIDAPGTGRLQKLLLMASGRVVKRARIAEKSGVAFFA